MKTYNALIRIVTVIVIFLAISSCSRTDEKIISKIEKDCNVSFDHQTNGVGAQVYHLWSVKGDEIFSYDEKMKNIIDKELNILPDKKEERQYNPNSGKVESYYHWETPKTSVELSIEYHSDKGGSVKVYMVNK